MKFDENYFKTVNYINYLAREDKYIKLARELVLYLEKSKFLRKDTKMLDFGCAVGFLINGIKKQNYTCAGYDISEWAKKESYNRYGIEYIEYNYNKFDIMFCLDVFEHMTDDQITDSLLTFDPEILVIRIPCAADNQSEYYLEISKNDNTHINCKDKNSWIEFFKKHKYVKFTPIDLYTIYDSIGVMCYIISK